MLDSFLLKRKKGGNNLPFLITILITFYYDFERCDKSSSDCQEFL